MKSTAFKSTVIALIVSSPVFVMAAEPLSQPEAINHPVEAIVQIPVAGVKVAAGVASLPFMFIGEVGNVSEQIGETLWQVSSHKGTETK